MRCYSNVILWRYFNKCPCNTACEMSKEAKFCVLDYVIHCNAKLQWPDSYNSFNWLYSNRQYGQFSYFMHGFVFSEVWTEPDRTIWLGKQDHKAGPLTVGFLYTPLNYFRGQLWDYYGCVENVWKFHLQLGNLYDLWQQEMVPIADLLDWASFLVPAPPSLNGCCQYDRGSLWFKETVVVYLPCSVSIFNFPYNICPRLTVWPQRDLSNFQVIWIPVSVIIHATLSPCENLCNIASLLYSWDWHSCTCDKLISVNFTVFLMSRCYSPSSQFSMIMLKMPHPYADGVNLI